MIQPTTTPQIGSTHQYGNASTMKITGIPSRKPKMKPKLIISRSSSLADVLEHLVGELGVRLHVADHHQLRVEDLIDVLGDLVGDDLLDDLGELLLDPGVDRLAHPRRQVVPELGVLALHDPLDHVADVVLGDAVTCSAICSGSSCW